MWCHCDSQGTGGKQAEHARGGQLGTTLPTPVLSGVPALRAGRVEGGESKPVGLLSGNLTTREGQGGALR